MVQRIENMFTTWEFTEAEEMASQVLPDLNYKHIQNELAVAATEQAIAALDPENPIRSQMQREFNRGRIEALQALLATSEDAKSELQRALEAQSDSRNPLTAE